MRMAELSVINSPFCRIGAGSYSMRLTRAMFSPLRSAASAFRPASCFNS
jgi:hypothetical protein